MVVDESQLLIHFYTLNNCKSMAASMAGNAFWTDCSFKPMQVK